MDERGNTDKQKKGGLPKLNDSEVPPMPTTTAPFCEQCGCCRFWKRLNDNSQWGRCRFNPPTADRIHGKVGEFGPIPSSNLTVWPDTCETDWCGKFSPESLSGDFMRYETWKAEIAKSIRDKVFAGIDPFKKEPLVKQTCGQCHSHWMLPEKFTNYCPCCGEKYDLTDLTKPEPPENEDWN